MNYASIETYRDLLNALQNFTEEQLDQLVQVIKEHPVSEYVHALSPVVCLGTVDELQIRYARSSIDNRRHGDEVVLCSDRNGFGEDGACAYEIKAGASILDDRTPIYPDGHDDASDWSGPAQVIADKIDLSKGTGTLHDILRNRVKDFKRDEN